MLPLNAISFELVPRAQTQNGVLAGLGETKCAAYRDMEIVVEFGFKIYARVLLSFVRIERQTEVGVAGAAVEFDAPGDFVEIPAFRLQSTVLRLLPGLFSAFGFEKRIVEAGGIAERPETVVEFDFVDPVEGDRQPIGEIVPENEPRLEFVFRLRRFFWFAAPESSS